MTVFPSPSLAIRSKVSIETPSILLTTVNAGMYLRVPGPDQLHTLSRKRQLTKQHIYELVGRNLEAIRNPMPVAIGDTDVFSYHDVAIVY